MLVLWSAIQTGAFYGLLGLAYFLVQRSTGILNFAVGAYTMLGGITYGYLSGGDHLGVLPSIVAGLTLAMAAAVGTEMVVVRPVAARGRNEFTVVMAVVALLFVLQQVAAVVYGHQAVVSARMLDGFRRWGDFVVDDQQILGVVIALAVFTVVAVWVQFGRHGRMLRAVGDNPHAAAALGLPVNRVRIFAMAVAGLVAGTAGVTVAPLAGVTIEAAVSYTIVGFIAMVLGGLGTPWAPLVGGLLLGVLQTYGSRHIGGASADYILLAVVVVLFTFRPSGIFSVRVRI